MHEHFINIPLPCIYYLLLNYDSVMMIIIYFVPGLRAVMTWTLGLGLSCLLGLVIGIAVRPYIIPHVSSFQLVMKILYGKGFAYTFSN